MTVSPEQIERWLRQGHSQELINRWVRNDELARRDAMGMAQRMQDLAARRRGVAPGTPADATPVVIDNEPATCPDCHGIGWVLGLGDKLKPCEKCGADKVIAAQRAKSLDKYSSASGRATAQTFGNFQAVGNTGHIVSACRRWAEQPTGWVVIWGKPGNGKSHLCAASFNVMRQRGLPAIFTTGPELMRSLRTLMDAETAEAEGETVAQRTEKYQRAPALILDDVRAEQRTDWSDGVWFDILDFRYRNRLPTMIATNCDPAGVDFPGRISSRLRDEHDGFSLVLHNPAPDYRTHQGEL